MRTTAILLAGALAGIGCKDKVKDDNPKDEAPAQIEPKPASPAAAGSAVASGAAAAAGKCDDGKITITVQSERASEKAVLFCKSDGTPAIQGTSEYRGEESGQNTHPVSIETWNKIWDLADKAGWRNPTGYCAPAEAGPATHILVYRDKVKGEVKCEGELAAAWRALEQATWDAFPATARD